MEKWCLHASSFIFDRIIIKVAGNQDRHKSSILGLWFPWPIYMFFEMRFNLGTLDSGERSLPFGLLVSSSERYFKCKSCFRLELFWNYEALVDRLSVYIPLVDNDNRAVKCVLSSRRVFQKINVVYSKPYINPLFDKVGRQ